MDVYILHGGEAEPYRDHEANLLGVVLDGISTGKRPV